MTGRRAAGSGGDGVGQEGGVGLGAQAAGTGDELAGRRAGQAPAERLGEATGLGVEGSTWAEQFAARRRGQADELAGRRAEQQPGNKAGRWAERLDEELAARRAARSAGEAGDRRMDTVAEVGQRWVELSTGTSGAAPVDVGVGTGRWGAQRGADGDADRSSGAWAERTVGDAGHRRHRAGGAEENDERVAGTSDGGGAGAPLDEGFGSFDRLFDWRYQSPSSGRHRSAE